jgi:hypothetical protein
LCLLGGGFLSELSSNSLAYLVGTFFDRGKIEILNLIIWTEDIRGNVLEEFLKTRIKRF